MGAGARPKAGRWLGSLLLAVAAATALTIGVRQLGRRREVRASLPIESGRLRVPGVAASVTILRDARGVPHARAASARDAWFALGFAQAQDRPGQLLWLRRAARGRVAEVEGRSALALDREARVLGFAKLGAAEAARLPPGAREALDAFAAGVDAGLRHWDENGLAAPAGLDELGSEDDPWRAADSLAIAKLLAWALSGSVEESLALSDLIQRFGGFEAALFFPSGVGSRALPPPGEGPQPARGGVPAPLVASGSGLRDRAAGEAASRAPLRRALGLHGPSVGSSAFALDARRTRSGRPLLVADAHYEPTVPAPLYVAHLEGGDLDVAGAAPVGVPVFWTGFNREVAWASTQAGAVVSDLYVESLSPDGPPRYHDGEAWRPLAQRHEEIAVRGGDRDLLAVRETRHGPLVNPLLPSERPPLALRWTGGEPGAGIAAFLQVARARSAAELREALRAHREPVLAVVYAARAGEAGLQVAGLVPERVLATSLLPVPGRDRDYDWRGALSPERLPARSTARGDGVVVAADGALAPDGHGIEWLWRPGERSARIEALLAQRAPGAPIDLHGAAAALGDLRSERAGEVIDLALALVARPSLGPPEREVAALLAGWDRRSAAESRGAAAYHVFLDRLLRELFEPRMGAELLRRYLGLGRVRASDLARTVLAEAARGGASPWSDPAEVAAAVARSLRGAWLRLSAELGTNREKWTWGRLHPLRFRPLLPGSLAGEGIGPFAYPGDPGSVQVADYHPLASFAVSAVASFRFAVDAGALDEALAGLAPGQSEHPAHPRRRGGLDDWLAGRGTLLATSRLVVDETAVSELVLEPAGAAEPEP